MGRSKDWFVEAIVGIICEIGGLKSYASRYGDYSGNVTPSRGGLMGDIPDHEDRSVQD